MTLALLLTAVTGAWAEETPLVTINASSEFKSGSKTFDNKVTVTFSNEVAFIADNGWCAVAAGNKTLTVEPVDGVTITRVKFYTTLGNAEDITAPFEAIMNSSYVYVSGNPQSCFHVSVNGSRIGAEDTHNYLQRIEVYGTAEPPLTVAWNASTKTGNFTMPGSDVVLTPIYAKAATFATTGTEPEVKTLLPEAAEGVIAGTDASLIAEGTGIVAFAGTSTEVTQGTLMYAIGTSATQAPDAFSATVPTAKTVADDGAEVYVWYYIKGADTPANTEATEENTFNDTEPACLTVTVLTNKFDIQFNAANANTIEAGKATVTVDGTAATVTEGKLQGVKMGREVKLKAKEGYKFRKVEVKKKASTPTLKDALADGATVVINCVWDAETTFTYTNNGGNYTGSTTGYEAAYFANGMSKDGTTLKFTASNLDLPQANVSIDFFTDSNEYYFNSKGDAFESFTISVNGTDITSQLTEVK